jgi:hypothetical protein
MNRTCGTYLLLAMLLATAGCGKSYYTPAALRALSEKNIEKLEGKWIKVRGPITKAKYFKDGAPLSLIPDDTGAIAMQEEGKRELAFMFKGPKSGRWSIDSLSRDDVVTIKGKVTHAGKESLMCEQCELLSGP